MPTIKLELLKHQLAFLQDRHRFCALIGGFGSGKTKALATKLIYTAALHSGYEGVALSPVFGEAKRVLIPGIINELEASGIKYRYMKSDALFQIKFEAKTTNLWVLSAENFERAKGMNLAFFGVDEIDRMNTDVAAAAWQELSLRIRFPKPGQITQGFCVSTPEGFGFLYDWFKRQPDEDPAKSIDRFRIHAKMTDNPFLPQSYIDSIRMNTPPHLLAAVMDGQFINMNQGSVYPDFDRVENGTKLTINDLAAKTPLHIGIDFNVKNQKSTGSSVVVAAIQSGIPHFINERMGDSRTTEIVKWIKDTYPNRSIYVYPDASARNEKTSAAESDLTILKNAGFILNGPKANPRVKDRVNAVNTLLLNSKGIRRLFINPRTCPRLTEAIEQQPYGDDGAPLKDKILDGPPDALGYLIHALWPVTSSQFEQTPIKY